MVHIFIYPYLSAGAPEQGEAKGLIKNLSIFINISSDYLFITLIYNFLFELLYSISVYVI